MENIPLMQFEQNYEIDPKPLVDKIGLILGSEFTFEEIDGTFEIDSDTLRLSFALEDDFFEIRSIEALEAGLGNKIISQIHQFADINKMSVIASNVKDTAEGFWRKMGYEESSENGQFLRNN